MKTKCVRRFFKTFTALLASAAAPSFAQIPFEAVGDFPADPQETQQLTDTFSQARAAAAAIQPELVSTLKCQLLRCDQMCG